MINTVGHPEIHSCSWVDSVQESWWVDARFALADVEGINDTLDPNMTQESDLLIIKDATWKLQAYIVKMRKSNGLSGIGF